MRGKNSTEYCLKVMVILKNENSVFYFINHMTKDDISKNIWTILCIKWKSFVWTKEFPSHEKGQCSPEDWKKKKKLWIGPSENKASVSLKQPFKHNQTVSCDWHHWLCWMTAAELQQAAVLPVRTQLHPLRLVTWALTPSLWWEV